MVKYTQIIFYFDSIIPFYQIWQRQLSNENNACCHDRMFNRPQMELIITIMNTH